MTHHQPTAGRILWVDHTSRDLDRAVSFYRGLLGWDVEATDTPAGPYAVARLDEEQVAGLMPIEADAPPGRPDAWTVYLGTDDLDRTVAAATSAGGTVLLPPMDIGEGASVAVLADPVGAVLGVMSDPSAAPLPMGTEGTLYWAEVLSRDPGASRKFLESTFGWTAEEGTGEDPYTVFRAHGEAVAGLMAMPPDVPEEAPSHWLVYFGVDDLDDALEDVVALGGSRATEPMEIADLGRFAVIQDPGEAVLALFDIED